MTVDDIIFEDMQYDIWLRKVTSPLYYSPFLTDPNFVSAMLLNVYFLIGVL